MRIQVKIIRAIKNITQEGLASATGLTQSEISEIENGKRSPSLKTMERLAAGLNCEVKDLVDANLNVGKWNNAEMAS